MATVRETRKRQLMTQADLAKKAQVGLSTIIRLEKGLAIYPAMAKSISKALGVNIETLDGVKVFSGVRKREVQ